MPARKIESASVNRAVLLSRRMFRRKSITEIQTKSRQLCHEGEYMTLVSITPGNPCVVDHGNPMTANPKTDDLPVPSGNTAESFHFHKRQQEADQAGLTLSARGPFSLWPSVYSTVWPS